MAASDVRESQARHEDTLLFQVLECSLDASRQFFMILRAVVNVEGRLLDHG